MMLQALLSFKQLKPIIFVFLLLLPLIMHRGYFWHLQQNPFSELTQHLYQVTRYLDYSTSQLPKVKRFQTQILFCHQESGMGMPIELLHGIRSTSADLLYWLRVCLKFEEYYLDFLLKTIPILGPLLREDNLESTRRFPR